MQFKTQINFSIFTFQVSLDEEDRLQEASIHLQLLYPSSRALLKVIEPLSSRFRLETVELITIFQQRVATFTIKLDKEGPESEGLSLEEGCLIVPVRSSIAYGYNIMSDIEPSKYVLRETTL